MSFPNNDGTRDVWHFTLKFDYAELAIQWTNKKRKFLNQNNPNKKASVVFRFLDLNEEPGPRSIVHNLEKTSPSDIEVSEILVLPCSIE